MSVGPAFGSNPHGQSPLGADLPAPQTSRWVWILGIFGAAGLVILLCAGAGLWIGLSTYDAFIAEELRKEFIGDVRIKQTLGEVKSLTIRWFDSVEQTQNQGTGGRFLVVDAQGSTAAGKLIVELAPDAQPSAMFRTIELHLPGGDTIPIK